MSLPVIFKTSHKLRSTHIVDIGQARYADRLTTELKIIMDEDPHKARNAVYRGLLLQKTVMKIGTLSPDFHFSPGMSVAKKTALASASKHTILSQGLADTSLAEGLTIASLLAKYPGLSMENGAVPTQVIVITTETDMEKVKMVVGVATCGLGWALKLLVGQ